MKIIMERLIVLFISLLVVLAVELPYFFGKFQETAGTLYLGTVHYPPDYLYYLSQIVQGQSHFLYSTVLYTTEKLPYVLVGWQQVFWGRIMSILGIRVIEGYQLMVVVTLGLFLFLSYKFITLIYPDDRSKRLLAFFFFITSTSLPKIVESAKGWDLSYFWYWYNHGHFLVRFGPTPHHLLANSMMVLIVILFLSLGGAKRRSNLLMLQEIVKGSPRLRARDDGENEKRSLDSPPAGGLLGMTILLIVSSIILASINPVYWGIISIVLFLSAGIRLIRRISHIRHIRNIQERIGDFLPFFLVLISGLPVAIYVKHVFTLEPYAYSHIWESQQQVWVNLPWLIAGSGLVIVFGIIGGIRWVWEFWKNQKMETGKTTVLILLTVCAILYMSQIPYKLGLTNVRFWSSSLYIIWGALAAEGIMWLVRWEDKSNKIYKTDRGRRIKKSLIFSFLMMVYLVSIIPTHFVSFRDQFVSKKGDAFYYLPKDAYEVYLKAKNLGNEKTVYLVEWPFDETFPALTGRESFFGFYLLTINSAEKEKQAFSFFDGKMEEKEVKKFLERNQIEYIIGYPWTPKIKEYPFIKEEYKNGFLGVYRVNLD